MLFLLHKLLLIIHLLHLKCSKLVERRCRCPLRKLILFAAGWQTWSFQASMFSDGTAEERAISQTSLVLKRLSYVNRFLWAFCFIVKDCCLLGNRHWALEHRRLPLCLWQIISGKFRNEIFANFFIFIFFFFGEVLEVKCLFFSLFSSFLLLCC